VSTGVRDVKSQTPGLFNISVELGSTMRGRLDSRNEECTGKCNRVRTVVEVKVSVGKIG
jgi:hypothetical protein